MERKRLSKALAAAGVASRRAAEELIFSGRVSVNGSVIKLPQHLVDWSEDSIELDGEKLAGEERKLCFCLNKPKGFLCSNERIREDQRLVIDLFPDIDARLFTVGRLDKDTSGLILVTNDGAFANRVIHPSSRVQKEYLVKTRDFVDDTHLKSISKGGFVQGIFVKPLRVQKVRKGTLTITVMEGKKHEVRLLVKRAGLHLLSLERIRIGGLTLGKLPPGHYRSLDSAAREVIFH